MRHRRRTQRFNRKLNHRIAMFRNLMISLVEHGRIRTTIEKAKELRRHIERAVTKGKAGDLAAFRLLLSRIPHEETVKKLVKEVSPRFKDRSGGYTRLIKLGKRPGDSSEMAFIEWVDYDYKTAGEVPSASVEGEKKSKAKVAASKSKEAKTNAKADLKVKSKLMKLAASNVKAQKKAVRKIQVESRKENRQA